MICSAGREPVEGDPRRRFDTSGSCAEQRYTLAVQTDYRQADKLLVSGGTLSAGVSDSLGLASNWKGAGIGRCPYEHSC